jgi:hypothetical protein
MAATSGVVQRLKWADSARAVLVQVGPTPTAVELFLVTFDTSDAGDLARKRAVAHLLGRAFSARLPVTIFHESGDAVITGVDVRFADVRVDGIEVTQAIQNLNHSVPLIALKATVARVYLSTRLPAPVMVRGALQVRRTTGGASRTLLSLNTVTLDPARFGQVDPLRRDVALSLNFALPTDMIAAGQLVLAFTSLTDAATGQPLVCAPPGDLATVSFINSPPLRLRLVGFSYPFGTPPQTRVPTSLDLGLTISWLQRAYPVAQVLASQAIVSANAAAPFGCGDINAQLAALRALDVSAGADARTHYYGIVSDSGFFMRGCAGVPSSPDPSAVGSGPTGPASWGWDFDGSYGDWYAGHELGHTFGRRHPGFCGESADDPAYPFVGGQLANADNAYVGFDVGDPAFGLPMTALPGTDWHDVMTYCSTQWLSSYTYTGIRTRLVAEDALGPGGGAGRPDERFPPGFKRGGVSERRTLVTIVAEVNVRRRTGRIAYALPVARGTVTVPDPGSPVTIRTRGADGRTLDEVGVPVKPFAEEGPEDAGHALCDPIIAVHPAAAAIELDVSGTVVDTLRPAATPPIMQDARFSRAGDDALMLRWGQGQARAEQRLAYIVQMSGDNGRSWQTLAVGLRSPELAIHPDNVPRGRRLLFRVQATDGFRAAETVVEWPGQSAAPEGEGGARS